MHRERYATSVSTYESYKRSPFPMAIFLAAAFVGTCSAQQFTPVSPLYFAMPQGGQAPPLQIVTLTSTTTGVIEFSTTASTVSGGSWLKIGPTGSYYDTPDSIYISIDSTVATTLAAGTYTGSVQIKPTSSSISTITITVTLTVSNPATAFFDNLPGGLNFTLTPGGQPDSQVIEVRNGGSGTLNWNVTPQTSSANNWL